jgi:protocatechuate 3,4-dioxygenase alpha subunit
MTLVATPAQTVGPFFHIGCSKLMVADVAGMSAGSACITIQGRIFDGDGNPVPDAMIEIWQANASGEYTYAADTRGKAIDPGFRGYGRVATDQHGNFRFTTIKPGLTPGPASSIQSPHLVISIFMRGLMKRLMSRMYFPDELANSTDPVLRLVEPERCGTLIAQKSETSRESYRWDVHLQGKSETVFFDI